MQTIPIKAIQVHGRTVATLEVVTVSAEALEGWPCGKTHPFAQQGDLYFYRLASLPAGAVPLAQATGQLAPGTTQGSRHCVDPTHVTLYQLAVTTALDGPVIDAPAGVVITHPEHGHLVFPPVICGVTYQRQYAEELRRVMD